MAERPGLQHRAHAGEIDGGLARAGNAVDEHAGELVRVYARADSGEGRFLRRVEIEFERRRPRFAARYGKHRSLFRDFDCAAAHEGAEGRARDFQCLQRVHVKSAAGSRE